MQLHRYLKEEFIRLDLDAELYDHLASSEDEEEEADDEPAFRNAYDSEDAEEDGPGVGDLSKRQILDIQKEVLRRLVALLDKSGRVANPTKLLNDLFNREKKATMAMGGGFCMPHVRTMQARELAMAIGVAKKPIPWLGAKDGEGCRVFLCMIAPPHDDKTYLQVLRRVGELFGKHDGTARILAAKHPGEIIRFVNEAK